MAENKTVILKASGLQTSPNELSREDGALIEASNVIIKRDNIVEQRRGFDLYGSPLPNSSQRVKQLTSYRNRILRHYSNKLQFDSNGIGTFYDFSGDYSETEAGLRMKFVESNGNLYFTTSNGIKKISARTSNDFTTANGYVVNAGAIKAVDLTGKVIYVPNSQSAWMPQDSVVAYRVLWAYRDLNTNLVRGVPSQRLVVSNPMIELLLQDYMRLLSAIDNLTNPNLSSVSISDKNYIETLGVDFTSTASQLRSSIVNLASKLDNDILFANQGGTAALTIDKMSIDNGICTIKFSAGIPSNYINTNSVIYISGTSLSSQNEIQKITFSSVPNAGNWKITNGTGTTAAIAYNATAGNVQTALNAVTGLEDVTVSGDFSTGFLITFPSSKGDVGQLTVVQNTLTASAVPVIVTTSTEQHGVPTPSGDINGIQEIVGVGVDEIWFNTTAKGSVTLSSSTIHSGTFRNIEEPSEVSLIATNDELVSIQTYLLNIIVALTQENDAVVDPVDKPLFEVLDITTTVTTELTITIPEGITSHYFFQVFRSPIAQATGAATFEDLVPSDELQLVYEAYPTPEELSEGFITFEDITPDVFRGENLYTNASTGEGILQSNEIPPFAKDINRYRNCVFYANTRTRQRMDLNLLGVTKTVESYDPLNPPSLVISDGDSSITYTFVLGKALKYVWTAVDNVADSLNGKYFLFDTMEGSYYVWFDSNSGVDPLIINRTGIKIQLQSNETKEEVARLIYNNLVTKISELKITRVDEILEVENISSGFCAVPDEGTSGFGLIITQTGSGESIQDEITEITTIPGSDFSSIGTADYFLMYDAFDRNVYMIWFNYGAVTQPVLSGVFPIEIPILGTETDSDIASLIANKLAETGKFEGFINGNTITVNTIISGPTSQSTSFVADPDFQVSRVQEGRLTVLLSDLPSPARAVDETARSLVRVINKNRGDIVYAYYLSSVYDVPGKMNIESRSLEDKVFYILANSLEFGMTFQPDIGPELSINSITSGSSPLVTLNEPHNLLTGDKIVLSGTNTNPVLNGLFTVEVVSSTSFRVNGIYLQSGGTEGVAISAANSLYSQNENRGNRVYYSKFQQPEAVPLVNYFDVGAQDKDILRILPLRDSLFVFKEDGVYRISGESAPFQLELFDNSFILIAPDSASVCNNIIYCWTKQGIQSLSESGSSIVSRAIDNIVLKTQSSNFRSFPTATWGLGYESDNSYIVFTVKNISDEVATIGYRYSTLTNSWTTFDMSKQAGIIHSFDDKMYLSALDVPYIEQERKTFSRLDYTDRTLDAVIEPNALLSNRIILQDVSNLKIGDVIVQNQTINTSNFNLLLNKLDLDPVAENDYFATLELKAGMNPRTHLVNLANKLDSDSGIQQTDFYSLIETRSGTVDGLSEEINTVITSVNHGLITGRVVSIINSQTVPSIDGEYEVTVLDSDRFSINVRVFTEIVGGIWQTVDSDFQDLKTCFNEIIRKLNLDAILTFTNYRQIEDETLYEAIITDINTITRTITLNLTLDFLVGDIEIFKAIKSVVTYSPITMGDPLMSKHIREATLMFETRNITFGKLSFYTDLLPEFQDIDFKLDGNGIFGHVDGFGGGFFGGIANSAPFRTYIPRQCQRCRFIVMKFTHETAREDYRLNGATLTARTQLSTRAYR